MESQQEDQEGGGMQDTHVATVLMTDTQAIKHSQQSAASSLYAADDTITQLGGSLDQIKPSRNHDTANFFWNDEDEDKVECVTPQPKRRNVPRITKEPSSATSTLTSSSQRSQSAAGTISTSTSPASATAGLPACQKYLAEHGNSKKILFAMLIGLKKDDVSFGDPEHKESFWNCKGKSLWMPSKEDVINEIQQRHSVMHPENKPKACSSWKKHAMKKWLLEHPITDPRDVTYLFAEEKKFRHQMIASQDEKN